MTSLGVKTGLITSKGEAPDFFGGFLRGLKLRGLLSRAPNCEFTATSLGSSSRLTREFEFPGLLPEERLLSYLRINPARSSESESSGGVGQRFSISRAIFRCSAAKSLSRRQANSGKSLSWAAV